VHHSLTALRRGKSISFVFKLWRMQMMPCWEGIDSGCGAHATGFDSGRRFAGYKVATTCNLDGVALQK